MLKRFGKTHIVIALLCLAFIIRIIFLGRQSIWMDEGFSFWMANQPLSSLLKAITNDAHPILYYSFLHFWMMGGHSEFYLRLPTAIFGVVNCAAFYLLADELFGSPTSLFMEAFWACSFVTTNQETQVRMYGFAVTFSLLSALFLWRALKKQGKTNWIFYFLCAVFSLYTHYFTAFVILAQLILLVSMKRLKEAGWIAASLFLAFSPWLPIFFQQFMNGVDRVLPRTRWGDLFDFFNAMLGARHFLTENLSAKLSFFAVCMLVLGGVQLIRKRKEANRFLLLLFLVPCLVPFLVTYYTPRHIFMFRYTTIFLPYFFLLFFYGLFQLPRALSYPCFFSLLFVNLALRVFFLTGPAFQEQNWRGAAKILNNSLKPGDTAFLESNMSMYPLAYYLPRILPMKWHDGFLFIYPSIFPPKISWQVADKNTPISTIKEIIKHSKRQWLVLCQASLVDPKLVIPGWFYINMRQIQYYEFRSIERQDEIFIVLFSGWKKK